VNNPDFKGSSDAVRRGPARRCRSIVLVLLLLAPACQPAGAAVIPTILDPSFGSRGLTITDIGGPVHEDEPFTLIADLQGRYVAPGKAFNPATGTFDFAILRYTSEGILDPSFSGDGIALTDFGAYEEAQGIVEQADGKLVAGGFTKTHAVDGDFALARYNTDGSLDPSFGDGGRVTTDFRGALDQMLTLAIQADGKVVAAGFSAEPAVGSRYDLALARYNPDGSLDPSFGAGGKVITDFAGGADYAFRMLIQPDGRIVCFGATVDPATGNQNLLVARYNPDGSLDPTFGPAEHPGWVATDFYGGADYGFTGVHLPGGELLVGGLAYNPASDSSDMVLVRYLTDGSVDESFASDDTPGFVTVDFFGDYDQILALAIQPDGKILAAGHAKHPVRHFDFAFARFTPDGRLDPSFGTGGKFWIDVFGGADGLHGLVLQPDGKAVAAGDSYNPATQGDDFVLVRLLVADLDWAIAAAEQEEDQAYASPAAQGRLLEALAAANGDLADGRTVAALDRLEQLRPRMDGCGRGDRSDDWLVDCAAQYRIRALVEQVIYKLGGGR